MFSIKADSLVPSQVAIGTIERQKADYYEMKMLKHLAVFSYFLSREALLYAGLMEGDNSVISYTPNPFLLRIGKISFRPEFYVSKRQTVEVIFFETTNKMLSECKVELDSFFSQRDIRMLMLNTDEIFKREIEAENWLDIVRRVSNYDIDSVNIELAYNLLHRVKRSSVLTLGEIIDRTNRDYDVETEMLLFWLLLKGRLIANLEQHPLIFP